MSIILVAGSQHVQSGNPPFFKIIELQIGVDIKLTTFQLVPFPQKEYQISILRHNQAPAQAKALSSLKDMSLNQ